MANTDNVKRPRRQEQSKTDNKDEFDPPRLSEQTDNMTSILLDD